MNYVVKISEALGPERAEVFKNLVAYMNLRDDDEELALAAATASLMVDFRQVVTRAEELTEQLGKIESSFRDAPEAWRDAIDVQVAKSVGVAMDTMTGEIQEMARTTANAEYNAAALVRNRAITDETQALIAATKAAAQGGVGEGGAGVPAMGRGNGLLRFVGLVAAFVVGVAVEFFWYRAHYLPHVGGHG